VTHARPAVSVRRAWLGLAVAGAGLAGLTAGLLPARQSVSLANVVLLYLVPVVTAAVVGGVRPALAAALGADLVVNFFFIPPYHTFAVETGDNVIVLVVYVLVAAAVSAAVEVSARQRGRAAQREAEARDLATVDRVRSALLAAVGHDLRTPLAGIKAAASSLRQPDVRLPPDATAELLATIEESTDRLDGLVENLLSMSRLQAGVLSVHPEPVPLDAVVGQALLHVPGGEAPIEVDVPDDLPLAQADPGLLERVVANLVANAVAASPTDRAIRLHGRADAQWVWLHIIDHGPGVPAGEVEQIFEAFQRRHDRTTTAGLGLGLAIARGFTEAIGGTLTPAETPGGGLTMTVRVLRARS
jgi:two-component system sensor histidine kinase KdpD